MIINKTRFKNQKADVHPAAVGDHQFYLTPGRDGGENFIYFFKRLLKIF